MKRLLSILTISTLIYASNTNEINAKLDLILNKINMLEKKLNEKDKEIKKLKQEIKKQEASTKKEFAIKSCNKLKITKFSYKYNDNVLPYYNLSFTLKNQYPYTISKITGNVYFDDKDGTTLLKHYVEKKLNLKPNESINISAEHMITSDIEKELKDENPNNLNVYFSPTKIIFKNGKKLECF